MTLASLIDGLADIGKLVLLDPAGNKRTQHGKIDQGSLPIVM